MESSYTFAEWEIIDFIMQWEKQRPKFYNEAACAGSPNSWFYPGQGQSSLAVKGRAKCSTCPVRKECFTYAMDQHDEAGIWGGSMPDQRTSWFASETSAEEAWEEMIMSEQLRLVDSD